MSPAIRWLMGADEEGTLAALKAIRRELGDPKIAEHRVPHRPRPPATGSWSSSPASSTPCAAPVEVQRAMAERTWTCQPKKRIEFRFGIHQGDIIVEDGDIFGDGGQPRGAAEGLAEPGGMLRSGMVHADAAGKVDVAFDDLGRAEPQKHRAPLLRVYRCTARGGAGTILPGGSVGTSDKPSIAGPAVPEQ